MWLHWDTAAAVKIGSGPDNRRQRRFEISHLVGELNPYDGQRRNSGKITPHNGRVKTVISSIGALIVKL